MWAMCSCTCLESCGPLRRTQLPWTLIFEWGVMNEACSMSVLRLRFRAERML